MHSKSLAYALMCFDLVPAMLLFMSEFLSELSWRSERRLPITDLRCAVLTKEDLKSWEENMAARNERKQMKIGQYQKRRFPNKMSPGSPFPLPHGTRICERSSSHDKGTVREKRIPRG